jgi:hypothetical protein
MAPKMPELPIFATEVRFYRDVLGVAYETGSRFRKLGILTPDAVCDGRPLFLLSAGAIEQARERIHAHRGRVLRVRHNLPVTALCQKTVTA